MYQPNLCFAEGQNIKSTHHHLGSLQIQASHFTTTVEEDTEQCNYRDPKVWGPPKDRQGAIELLREAAASGINHIDTADFYGPNVSHELIREALYPYPDNLVIVTKVGSWTRERQSTSTSEVLEKCLSNRRESQQTRRVFY
jgi:aryl-alcohol dehydrogenase-like predicted oxidoreductase